MSVRIVSATPAFRRSPDHLHTPALAPVATTSSRSTSKCSGVAVWRKRDDRAGVGTLRFNVRVDEVGQPTALEAIEA